MWVPSLEAGRPEDARRSLVAGTQDRACGERLLEEGHQGGTRVRSSRSGSPEDSSLGDFLALRGGWVAVLWFFWLCLGIALRKLNSEKFRGHRANV